MHVHCSGGIYAALERPSVLQSTKAGYIPPLHINCCKWLMEMKKPRESGTFSSAPSLTLPTLSKIRAPLMIVVLRLREVDPKATAIDLESIECARGAFSHLVGLHFNETEAA